MSAFILSLVGAVMEAGPLIYEAIRGKDAKLAQRRIREATDRLVLEAIAKKRLRERERIKKDGTD